MSITSGADELKFWLANQMQHLAASLLDHLLHRRNQSELVVSQTCSSELISLSAAALKNHRGALKVFDSSARLPSGIMSGGLFNLLGNYEQCLNQETSGESEVETKYCRAYFSTSPSEAQTLADLTGQPDVSYPEAYRSVKIGICVPSGCLSTDIKSLANAIILKTIGPVEVNCHEVECSNVIDTEIWTWPNSIVTTFSVGILLVIFFLIILATFADCYRSASIRVTSYRELLSKLSLSRGIKLLCSKRAKAKNGVDLGLFDGLRVMSMFWVIAIHSYSFAFQWLSFENIRQIGEVYKGVCFQWIANGTFCVDNFFLIGGFLAIFKSPFGNNKLPVVQSFSESRGRQRTYAKRRNRSDECVKNPSQADWSTFVNVCLMRYLRLMPTLMMLIMLSQFLLPKLAFGPGWKDSTMMFDLWCHSNWYLNLLMVHNFIKTPNMCFGHSWYLAVDLQLFVLVHFLLVLTRSISKEKADRTKHLMLFSTLVIVAQMSVVLVVINKGIVSVPLLPTRSLESLLEYFRLLYIKPYYWFASYTIGCLLAMILEQRYRKQSDQENVARNQTSNIRREQLLQIGSLLIMCALIFSSLPFFKSAPQVMPVWISATYSLLARPLWSLSLACQLFFVLDDSSRRSKMSRNSLVTRLACHFLKWPQWLPLSRLSYSAYLLHPIVMACFYGSRTESFKFSHGLLLYFTLGNIIITYASALVIYLFIEQPIQIAINEIRIRYSWSKQTSKLASTSAVEHELGAISSTTMILQP